MSWRPSKQGGWGKGGDLKPARFTQILRAVLEIVPGGVIRAGKTAYRDDTNVGFWIGIDADGLAKINIGGASNYFKWSGTGLEVAGLITGTMAISGGSFEWAGGKGVADGTGIRFVDGSAYWRVDLSGTELLSLKPSTSRSFVIVLDMTGVGHAWGLVVEKLAYGAVGASFEGSGEYTIGVKASAQGDNGYGVMGVAYGAYGVGVSGSAADVKGAVGVLAAASGLGVALKVQGGIAEGGGQRYTQMGDAVHDTDGLNRQTGDGRSNSRFDV